MKPGLNSVLMVVGLVLLGSIFSCRAYREVVTEKSTTMPGMEGLRQNCLPADTVRSVVIRKAGALFDTGTERYEAQVTVYALRDSLVYFSAVNSGFEVLRGLINKDSIRVIDRLNKVVYSSPVKRRFGYSHPVDFQDVQNLVSSFYLCDDLHVAHEADFLHIVFDFEDPLIKKQISYGRESLKLDKFEFYHTATDKYLMGERGEEGFRIYTNFLVDKLEISARGGERTYNESIPVKMDVNRRRYTFVNL
jgi:hypothetical protein